MREANGDLSDRAQGTRQCRAFARQALFSSATPADTVIGLAIRGEYSARVGGLACVANKGLAEAGFGSVARKGIEGL